MKNTGNAASAPPDTVQDTLPAGFVFVSGGGGGWTCTPQGQLVTCTRGTPIQPGDSSTLTITVAVPCGGPPVDNCAKVATTSELDLSDNSACDPTKVVVPAPAGGCAIAVGAGFAHSLVVRSDHKGFAWGANGGQLADGTIVDRTAPVAIQGLTGIAALTGGQGTPSACVRTAPSGLGGVTISEGSSATVPSSTPFCLFRSRAREVPDSSPEP